MEAQLPTSSRRAALIIAAGCAALVGFFIAWHAGYPGAGTLLISFGMLMVLLGGIEFLLSRLH